MRLYHPHHRPSLPYHTMQNIQGDSNKETTVSARLASGQCIGVTREPERPTPGLSPPDVRLPYADKLRLVFANLSDEQWLDTWNWVNVALLPHDQKLELLHVMALLFPESLPQN